jgi:hypothetical protein
MSRRFSRLSSGASGNGRARISDPHLQSSRTRLSGTQSRNRQSCARFLHGSPISRRAMSEDYAIYVDSEGPASLNNGAGVLTDHATLLEAVLACTEGSLQISDGGNKRRRTVALRACSTSPPPSDY